VGLAVFTYGPSALSLTLSGFKWDLLNPPRWVGSANYQTLIHDPLFWKIAANTAGFVASVAVLEAVLALAIAVWIQQLGTHRQWLKGVARTAVFLPYITPMVAMTLVFGWLYDGDQGLLNQALMALHLISAPIAWLQDPHWAMPSVIALEVWKNVGYNVVLLMAGLQALPEPVLEAATLDGASGWPRLVKVVLPMLSPTVLLVSMMTLIHALQAFDAIYLLTQGGPQHATAVVVFWVFQQAFAFYKAGLASALAYVLFVVIMAITAVQWRLRRRWVLHETEAASA
jgi:multiple sugar transport system permease protein